MPIPLQQGSSAAGIQTFKRGVGMHSKIILISVPIAEQTCLADSVRVAAREKTGFSEPPPGLQMFNEEVGYSIGSKATVITSY